MPIHNLAKAESCIQLSAVVLALYPGGGEGYGVFCALSPGAEVKCIVEISNFSDVACQELPATKSF